jgi:hypothetical protein
MFLFLITGLVGLFVRLIDALMEAVTARRVGWLQKIFRAVLCAANSPSKRAARFQQKPRGNL